MKNIYIITGGTMVHVTPHFSICAPAYGKVGLELYHHLNENRISEKYNIYLIKTKMAGFNSEDVVNHLKDLNIKSTIETNDDLEGLVTTLCQESNTKSIIMSSAICDFEPKELLGYEDKTPLKITKFGKDKKRLHKAHSLKLKLQPSSKIIDIIKKRNPQIFLVTFKTTAGETKEMLIEKSLFNLKRSSSNLVFGNDIEHKINLIVTEEDEVLSAETRESALEILATEFFKRIEKKSYNGERTK